MLQLQFNLDPARSRAIPSARAARSRTAAAPLAPAPPPGPWRRPPHDYVLVTLLFFPFVMMNTFVVLSMFLTVIGISFEDVREALLARVADAKARGEGGRTSAFLEDVAYVYGLAARALGACPGRAAPVAPADGDGGDGDGAGAVGDRALRDACARLRADLDASVDDLRAHQDLLKTHIDHAAHDA